MQWLKLAAARKNEVIVFHLTGNKEKVFDFERATHLKDLETGQIIKFSNNVANSAKAYFQSRNQYLKEAFSKNNISYFQLSMNEIPVNALSKFLITRSKAANVF